MGVWEADYKRDAPVLIRGEIEKISDTVPCGSSRFSLSPANTRSPRAVTATALNSRSGPPLQTTRSQPGSWSSVSGMGLVTSVDNFGTTGQLPSHPGLLDWLALRLIENDWSLKSTIRDIVLSRIHSSLITHHS